MVSLSYIQRMIRQFELDPPDSDYQRGYLACLEELERVAQDEGVTTNGQ